MRWLLPIFAILTTAASGSDWSFAEIDGRPTSADATVAFNEDGTISGSTGCNRFNGQARALKGQLLMDAGLAMTRRACAGEELATQEMRITALLRDTVSMQSDPFKDTLVLTGNGVVARLSRGSDTAAPDVAGSAYVIVSGVDATLNIRSDATTDSRVAAHAALGLILRNLGCEDRSDRTWCRVSYIDASGIEGWAAADYLSAATATRRAGAELFDEIGRLTCRTEAGAAPSKCDYGVAREADGSGAILIYLADNQRQLMEFRGRQVSGASNDGGNAEIAEASGDGVRVVVGEASATIPTSVLVPE